MPETKTMIRFFTIADYEEEEIWLHEQHKNGWKLHKMIPPCLYIFEKCTPEDVIYRLDYKNGAENANYFQLFTDYGWEYIGRCVGWLYFRKPASVQNTEQDGELSLQVDLRKNMDAARLHEMLWAWREQAAKLEAGEISQEEYDRWRYHYPEYDSSQIHAKVPPEGLI